MRIIHTGDLQLGVTTHSAGRVDPDTGLNARVADFMCRWQDCVRYAVDAKADALLVAGDAFEYPNPTAAIAAAFAQGVHLAASAMPVVLLTGNHDVPNAAGRSHALSVFQALAVPGVTVADRPRVVSLVTRSGPLHVACLPWPAKAWTRDVLGRSSTFEQRDALLGAYLESEVASLANRMCTVAEGEPSVLLAHIGVSEAQVGSESSYMLGRDVTLPLAAFRRHAAAFDYVALGHVHKCQMWPKAPGLDGPPWIAYCGSLDRVDFGEAAEPKGWLDVTLKDDGAALVEQVLGRDTTARRFVDIEADVRESADPTASALLAVAAHGDLTGAVVRLTVRLLPEQERLLREPDVWAALRPAWHVAPIVKVVERPARLRLGEDAAEVLALPPDEALTRYLNTITDLTKERSELLRITGAGLMRDVDGGQP